MKRSKGNRLLESGFYASIFTITGFSFYYTIGLLYTLAQGGDAGKFFLDSLEGGFFAFFFFWFVCWEITGMFEELNKRGRNDEQKDDGKKDPDQEQK